jgi:hypothetical protein
VLSKRLLAEIAGDEGGDAERAATGDPVLRNGERKGLKGRSKRRAMKA